MNDGPTYAIGLHLDEAGAGRLRALAQPLQVAGLTSILDGAIPPHLTLAAFGQIDLPETVDVLAAFFGGRAPLPLRFDVLGSFPSSGVLHATPVANAPLLALHAELHARLGPVTGAALEYYRPGQWNPHCTLGLGLSREELAVAYGLVSANWEPFVATLDRVALVVPGPPDQTLFTQPLAGPA